MEGVFPLTLDLIPATAWGVNIRTTVPKTEWDRLRRKVYADAGYKCEICGGKGPKHPVEAHERWHFEDGKIVLEAMMALCPSCHAVKHWGLSQMRGREEECFRHFCKVNGCDRAVAESYVAEQFQLWERRSEQEWTLDLKALAKYGVKIVGVNAPY